MKPIQKKSLDTEIIRTNQGIKTQVYKKAKNLPVHSKVSFKYKRNAITGEVHRAKRTASDWMKTQKKLEVNTQGRDTQNMFLKTLSRILAKKKDEFLAAPWLFDERKHVTMHLSFSSKNEKYCAYFTNKLVSFTSWKVKFNTVWNTCRIQLLFPIKENVQRVSCVICKGICL